MYTQNFNTVRSALAPVRVLKELAASHKRRNSFITLGIFRLALSLLYSGASCLLTILLWSTFAGDVADGRMMLLEEVFDIGELHKHLLSTVLASGTKPRDANYDNVFEEEG